ncbi:MAG: extracellular solute-binding protein, partial [Beijerinckiaceae bacterium]|nr:extracellular solute-binding protein [Beijerinckiaceae bacterium]
MRTLFLTLWLIALCPCGLPLPAVARDKVVNVYGWGDYIDPKVIEDFTKQSGIKVTYDAYESSVALEARLRPGNSGFDVVIVPGPTLRNQIAAGIYQKLDITELPHGTNLLPDVMARLASFDPGNQYAVNYMWFAAGIAYNAGKVREVIGDAIADLLRGTSKAPFASWGTIFQVDRLKKFASCGVTVLDNGEEMFALALIYLKGDPGSMRQVDLKRTAELLNIMRRNVKKFDSSGYADGLASGDICVAVGYSVDSYRARERAQEADEGIEIGFFIPVEGSLISLDNLAIPRDAPHAAEAYAFIDFLLRP